MGEILTAWWGVAASDYGVPDQGGCHCDGDTVFFGVQHDPFITPHEVTDEMLHKLTPPKPIIEDWNSTIPDNSIPYTWNRIKYEERYRDHIEVSADAQKALLKIRLRAKVDDVCIICSCKMPEFCIRRIIHEYLQEKHDIGG